MRSFGRVLAGLGLLAALAFLLGSVMGQEKTGGKDNVDRIQVSLERLGKLDAAGQRAWLKRLETARFVRRQAGPRT